MTDTVKAFTEKDAENLLKKWSQSNGLYEVGTYKIETLWTYSSSPFYSATAWLSRRKEHWGGHYRLHIHTDGEVTLFRDLEKDVEESDEEGC